jgi:hypothetical protein
LELPFVTTTEHTTEMTPELPCHRCGYDLRAQPPDGICPECTASVAEARKAAAIPRRPAWRDSDPRWRRRILAGAWILVLLPLIDVIRATGWAPHIPVPTVIGGANDPIRTLDDTFLYWPGTYQALIFCTGMVLLFSKERGRQRNRLDWTRRWGVLSSYVVLLLSAAPVLYISALVMVGISALFLSMPPEYQPPVTQWVVDVSTTYLRYGPQPKDVASLVLIGFSSLTVLLACAPLFDALRSTGLKRLAAVLLGPHAAFALLNILRAAQYAAGSGTMTAAELFEYGVYFRPEMALKLFNESVFGGGMTPLEILTGLVEVAKWWIVLSIAVWLTIARFAAGRSVKLPTPAPQGAATPPTTTAP